jgi:hypothetical protein
MVGFGVARKILEKTWEWLFGPDIFITYTRRDGEAYVRSLKAALERHYLVFLDDSSIHGGQSISERIRREIRRSRLHLVILTPQATHPEKAPWVFKEVALHFRERRRYAIQTLFFPPNTPENLPEGLKRLADHKGITEQPGAERNDSVSIKVLEAKGGREAPATIDALWTLAERHDDVMLEIKRGFSAVRQRTRMQQAAAISLCLLLFASTFTGLAVRASRQRLVFAQRAEQAEGGQRYLEAERLWLAAARVAPWGRAEFRNKWMNARQRRLLTPAAVVTLPPGWNCRAIGSRRSGWCLLVHRLHDTGTTNGRAALVDKNGWITSISSADDFNPRVLFQSEAAFLHAAGKVTRIDSTSGAERIETQIGGTSYRLASICPQIELGWKSEKLCVLAGLERPPIMLMLDAATLRVESRTELKLPIDLPRPDLEPDGSDRYGEAIFRLSTRRDRAVVALWRRFTEYKAGTMSWDLALQPQPHARLFDLPMTDIGPGSSPVLETVEISPEDQQIFLNIGAINFFGASPSRAGQNFWIALDTASARPPYLMESLISRVWPLRAHQRYEAYYAVGNDLRALTFADFVVTTRPAVGVLPDVQAADLVAMSDSAEPTLAAATAKDIVLIRAATPIFRVAAPQPTVPSSGRLHTLFADPAADWLAAAFEVQSDSNPQRIVIWKAGAPPIPTDILTEQELAFETQAIELSLHEPP